jgi:hypothetical protein
MKGCKMEGVKVESLIEDEALAEIVRRLVKV